MTPISERHRARYYIFKKRKKLQNVFTYQNIDTSQKARQFPLRFYMQKESYFYLRGFSWKFWIWYLYTKNVTLWVTWPFYIQKEWHFAKSKTICAAFFYTKARTLCVTQFSLNFWNLWRGGDIFKSKKQCTLR